MKREKLFNEIHSSILLFKDKNIDEHELQIAIESMIDDYHESQLKLLNMQSVSNNEAFKCTKCKDTGIYFFSDRVPETCECQSEVAVCFHTCKHNPHAPFVPEICDKCNSETLSEWQQTDC